MSMTALSSGNAGWRGKRASPASSDDVMMNRPVALSLAMHLGVAVIVMLTALSQEKASPAAGPTKALHVEIVQLPRNPSATMRTGTDAKASHPARREQMAIAQPQRHIRAAATLPHAARSPVALINTQAANKAPSPEPVSNLQLSGASLHSPGRAAAPRPSGAQNAPETQSDATPLLTQASYRTPPTPPRYPKRARDLNQEGEVLIRVRLSRTGSAEEVLVWKSSGFVLLDNSAQAAVRRWDFEPARRNGQPVNAWVQIPVRFSLH